jgi:hypothetical protein
MSPKVQHQSYLESSPEFALCRRDVVVKEYSRLNLTVPSDKLAAIVGVARQMQSAIGSHNPGGCHYLAGIYGGVDLGRELLWEFVGVKHERPIAWCAPTWSWASVGGTVSYPNGGLGGNFTVLEAIRTPTGPNQFGAVSYGYLILLGKTLRVR